MALDEPKQTANVFEIDGYRYLVDRDFLQKVQPIHVDFTPFGFRVSSAIDFGSGCGSSCSTEGSCCT